MSDDILERARAALDGVTEEPWKVVRNRDKTLNVIGGPDADGDTRKVCLVNYGEEANARFIAATRDLVPDMAAEIERLREALAHTAEQALAAEIPVGYGPEDKSQWTKGYDAAILIAGQ